MLSMVIDFLDQNAKVTYTLPAAKVNLSPICVRWHAPLACASWVGRPSPLNSLRESIG
jgi:hypothetical protein